MDYSDPKKLDGLISIRLRALRYREILLGVRIPGTTKGGPTKTALLRGGPAAAATEEEC